MSFLLNRKSLVLQTSFCVLCVQVTFHIVLDEIEKIFFSPKRERKTNGSVHEFRALHGFISIIRYLSYAL